MHSSLSGSFGVCDVTDVRLLSLLVSPNPWKMLQPAVASKQDLNISKKKKSKQDLTIFNIINQSGICIGFLMEMLFDVVLKKLLSSV